MKNHLLNAPKYPHITDALFAEMILDQAIVAFRKERLHQEIEQALQERNKERFLQLTNELKRLA